ncbi:hypothetical protein ABID22_002244 [Pontibacter aydingkolensis]
MNTTYLQYVKCMIPEDSRAKVFLIYKKILIRFDASFLFAAMLLTSVIEKE